MTSVAPPIIPTPGPAQQTALRSSPSTVAGFSGEVVYMYAFDVAYEMIRRPVPQLLGQPVAEFALGAGKRGPRSPGNFLTSITPARSFAARLGS